MRISSTVLVMMCLTHHGYAQHSLFFFSYRADCCFSPDDKILVTGTSVKKGGGNGKLIFFERETFQKVYEIDVTDAVCILFFF